MKIRLIGPPDIVRGWAKLFEAFQVSGDFYPCRGRGDVDRANCLRWYADVDDRWAEAVLKRGDVDAAAKAIEKEMEGWK